MPVYIHLSNLVIDKRAVAAKYPGGVDRFRADYNIAGDNFNQEDHELFGLAAMNPDELWGEMNTLKGHGIAYDEAVSWRNEMVVITRYGGPYLPPDWLRHTTSFAWHFTCSPAAQAKALRLSKTSMEEIGEMIERGEDVFAAFVE